ncbi:MAG: hypothetical protein AAF563_20330 [Pseudomonadota bacterium]
MTANSKSDRDNLLVAAISTLAGLGVPTGARFDGIEMPEQEAQTMIDDLYNIYPLGDEDRPLAASELRTMADGNTIYGAPYQNDPYVISFGEGGKGLMKIAGRPLETGTWWIGEDDDTISSQWEKSAGGRVITARYYATSEPAVFKHTGVTTPLPKAHWKMFILVPGLALEAND